MMLTVFRFHFLLHKTHALLPYRKRASALEIASKIGRCDGCYGAKRHAKS
jgi:hypothetical protein